MSANSPSKSQSNSQSRRLHVEKQLAELKVFMAKLPKDYESLITWKIDAERWIAQLDDWLADFQVMSSSYLKPKLMSTYRKLTEMFDRMEQKEMEMQKNEGSMYIDKRGVLLSNEQFEKLLNNNNNDREVSEKEDK